MTISILLFVIIVLVLFQSAPASPVLTTVLVLFFIVVILVLFQAFVFATLVLFIIEVLFVFYTNSIIIYFIQVN